MKQKPIRFREGILLQLGLMMLLVTVSAQAQAVQEDIVIGKKIEVHSNILKEDRDLWVYLPKDYGESSERHPVLYLLDGDWHFVHVSGILQFFSWSKKKIPSMIIVAVPNTHRGRDFSPSTWPGYKSYTGGADVFIRFLEKELIPYIESSFRTRPERILAGHSLAGTFALYAFLTRPELFDATLSLSPCLFWHDRFMLKTAEEFLKDHRQLDKKHTLYIAHEYTGGDPADTMREFVEAFQSRAPQNLVWTSRFKENEDHFSYVHKAFYEGLEFIFAF